MKKLVFLSIVVTTALVAIPSSIFAADEKAEAPRAGRPGRDPEARLKLMTEKLGLNDEQQGKIKAIYEKNAPKLKEIQAKGRQNLSEDDRTKLRELMKTQNEEVAAVLTPEQKEKMKELRTEGGRAGGGRGGKKAAESK
jgi:Spy/CpxP family protein refolding chaperone